MTVHHARTIALPAVLVGMSALVPLTACRGAQRPLHELRVLAEQGDPQAQFHLGQQYSRGRSYGQGVQRDQFEAVRWYRLAADQGHRGAQFNLGNMYSDGMGVNERDTAAADRWFRLAANQGYTLAQHRLGLRYSNSGQDVPQDHVEAHMWLSLAAEQSGENLREETGVQLSAGPPDLDKLVGTLADQYVTTRDAVAERMTPAQLAEANVVRGTPRLPPSLALRRGPVYKGPVSAGTLDISAHLMLSMAGSRRDSSRISWGSVSDIFGNLTVAPAGNTV